MPTPFDEKGTFDRESLRRAIDLFIEDGVSGFTALGVTSEVARISDRERSQILDATMEHINGRVPVIVGATGAGLETCLDYCADAKKAGAAGVMVSPPRMAKLSSTYIRRHFAAIAERFDFAIVVQDFPPISGYHMEPSLLVEICREVPSARTIKLEDAPTPYKTARIRELEDGLDIDIFGGLGGSYLIEELIAGANGAMTGFAYPRLLVEIVSKWNAGARDEATDFFYRHVPLMRFEFQAGIGMAIRKEILRRRGALAHATVRPPAATLDGPTREALDRVLEVARARLRVDAMAAFDRLVAASLPIVPKPIVRIIARPYVAGETLDDQIRVIESLNAESFMVACGILGEFVTRREESEEAVRDYRNLLDAIAARKLDSNVHIKPTHLGLKLDKDFCYDNVRAILEHAKPYGNFVRMDMEDSPTIDDTLDLYFRLREDFDNVGCVIQARMRRSLDDVRRLGQVKANVRLCKGVYLEPREVAFTDRSIIQENYVRLLDELLSAGCYVGIATHDELLVWEAERIVDRLGLDRERYEFQMLHGVEPGLRRIVRDAGHRLRVAVPFGPNWYPYSIRRLRKNPAIAGYVLKALFSGKA